MKYTATLKGKKTLEFSIQGSENEARKVFKSLAKTMDYELINIKKSLPKKD